MLRSQLAYEAGDSSSTNEARSSSREAGPAFYQNASPPALVTCFVSVSLHSCPGVQSVPASSRASTLIAGGCCYVPCRRTAVSPARRDGVFHLHRAAHPAHHEGRLLQVPRGAHSDARRSPQPCALKCPTPRSQQHGATTKPLERCAELYSEADSDKDGKARRSRSQPASGLC